MGEKQIDQQWIDRIVHDSQITQIDRLEKQRFPLQKKQQTGKLKEVKFK
jgi:hypothetical protein